MNGLNKSHANQQNAANYDGGGPEDAGGGLLAQLCGLFCKDTPFAEAFGVAGSGPDANANANGNANMQSQIVPIQHGERF